jgi:hypothetical protein
VASVVTAWLPLLDAFDAALDAQAMVEARSGPPPDGEAQIHAAYRALHTQLLELLRCAGLVFAYCLCKVGWVAALEFLEVVVWQLC